LSNRNNCPIYEIENFSNFNFKIAQYKFDGYSKTVKQQHRSIKSLSSSKRSNTNKDKSALNIFTWYDNTIADKVIEIELDIDKEENSINHKNKNSNQNNNRSPNKILDVTVCNSKDRITNSFLGDYFNPVTNKIRLEFKEGLYEK